MARIKTVFSSNSQLAHVWAQQNQSEGKNPSGSLYFRNTNELYSYGAHYLLAKIYKTKSKIINKRHYPAQKFALVNNYNYSSTTNRQRGDTIDALRGKMPYFYTPSPDSVSKTRVHLTKAYKNSFDYVLGKKRVTSQDDIRYILSNITGAFEQLIKFRNLNRLAPIRMDNKKFNECKKHLEAHLARYHELNTPEMLEKKAIEKEKREARKAILEAKKLEDAIQAFRNYEQISPRLRELTHDILRVQTRIDTGAQDVQTSRGAVVPLEEAKLMLSVLNRCAQKQNRKLECFDASKFMRIGAFRLESVQAYGENDFELKIGCHKILLSEANEVLQ